MKKFKAKNMQEMWDIMRKTNSYKYRHGCGRRIPGQWHKQDHKRKHMQTQLSNIRKKFPQNIIDKALNTKYKEEVLNVVVENRKIKTEVIYKGNIMRIMAKFLVETLKARRSWNNAF